MKKCGDSINLIMVAGALVGLIAVYIGFTFLKKGVREGLSDGAYTANDELIKGIATIDDLTKQTMTSLTDSPQTYIDMLNSFKNFNMAVGIRELVSMKRTAQFTTINDYDEAIRYLQNIGVSNTATKDDSIDATIIENNSATTLILNELNADNQAYIDLLTSHKKLKMAQQIKTLTTDGPENYPLSDFDDSIQYLNELSGNATTPEAPPPTLSTPNISFARK